MQYLFSCEWNSYPLFLICKFSCIGSVNLDQHFYFSKVVMNNIGSEDSFFTNPDRKRILDLIGFSRVGQSADGHYICDSDGNKYFDCLSQYGAVPFGHNSPVIWEAIQAVNRNREPALIQPFRSSAAEALAQRLVEVSPVGPGYVTFTCSGAETVEAAIKLARAKTDKKTILATEMSFHGKTLGALSATGNDKYKIPFNLDTTAFDHIPYGDLEALQQRLRLGDVAGFIVEPIQGEGGMRVPPSGYLKKAADICRAHKVLIIIDEIQSGLGRTGKLFACEDEGFQPDILLLAKALGGGIVPIGACICAKRVWTESFGHLHSSTFANNQLTCSVGLAVLEHLLHDSRQLIKNVAAKGSFLANGLQSLVQRYPRAFIATDGAGLMRGITLRPWKLENDYFLTYISSTGMAVPLACAYLLHEHKILTVPTFNKNAVLRLQPSLTVTYEELNKVLMAFDGLGSTIANGNFKHLLSFVTQAVQQETVQDVEVCHE
jgi:acetylornithine/succinyldiaminopimelate/putrescine aminotransferase